MENINIVLKRLDSSNRKIVKECLQLKDVPRFALCGELKEYIGERIEETDFDFGYFGPPGQTRFNITSNTNLAEALFLEKRGCVVLWTAASSGATKRASSTCTATTSGTAIKRQRLTGRSMRYRSSLYFELSFISIVCMSPFFER